MNSIPRIFNERLAASHLSTFTHDNIPNFEQKWATIKKWKRSCVEGDLERTKEKEIQGNFLTRVFDDILGYVAVTNKETDFFFQKPEFTSALDASEADCGLGFFSVRQKINDVRVVVELKDAKTDLDKKQNRSNHLTPVEQAFSYANKNGSKCGWVIVSNFIETRLYKSTSSLEYEIFDIRKMDDKAEFLRFYYFLCKNHLICENGKSIIDEMYQINEEMGIAISNDFYKAYKRIRNNLYTNLKEQNPGRDELFLFTKSQKIMDRFTFICFCEDCGLLPAQVFQRLIDSAHNSFSFSNTNTKLWDELRGLFNAIDKGSPPRKINRYNGGLFKADPDLDNLIVQDKALEAFTELSAYDFGSDLNVNILGQIFEQSISDVEELKNEISGVVSDSKGKKKEDGIFYTPYYVTRYIVEQTVGAFLKQKKEDLKHDIFAGKPFRTEVMRKSTKRNNTFEIKSWIEIPDERSDMNEDEKMFRESVINLHLEYWKAYEEVLKKIKICDPACGSGAFLNQCFDFLHEEICFVLDMKHFLSEQYDLFDIDKQILQNNLFGVDINPESVEITKLSLWLKTAKKDQTLASLDDNIKCGNSLIPSSEAAGELAFDWQAEFPSVFANGGFDIVVGNPPYGASVSSKQKDYITQHYSTAEGNFDTYRVFFELGFRILKQNGYLGYITPNTYFDLKRSGTKLRHFLFSNTLLKIVEIYNVFPTAVVEPVISIYQKSYDPLAPLEIVLVPRNTKLSSTFLSEGISLMRPQSDLRKNEDFSFNYKIDPVASKILNEVLYISTPLSEYCYVYNGAKPYEVGKGTPPQTKEMTDKKVYNGYTKVDDSWVPYMRGKRVFRFTNMWNGEYIKYGDNLAAPRSKDVFFRLKIFVRQTGDTIVANLDSGNVSNNTLHVVFSRNENIMSNKYLLGLLNSTLMTWIYQTEHPLEVGKPMAEVKKAFIEALPVVKGSSSEIAALENLVDELLNLCQTRYDHKRRFLECISNTYGLQKISETLESFDNLSFKDFLGELRKLKLKLSASQQMELFPLYKDQQQMISQMTATVLNLQRALDDLVFDIYGVSQSSANYIRKHIEISL